MSVVPALKNVRTQAPDLTSTSRVIQVCIPFASVLSLPLLSSVHLFIHVFISISPLPIPSQLNDEKWCFFRCLTTRMLSLHEWKLHSFLPLFLLSGPSLTASDLLSTLEACVQGDTPLESKRGMGMFLTAVLIRPVRRMEAEMWTLLAPSPSQRIPLNTPLEQITLRVLSGSLQLGR